MKTVFRVLAAALAAAAAGLCALALYVHCTVPDRYILVEGETLQLARGPFLTQKTSGAVRGGGSYELDLEMPGGIRVKTVQVDVVERKRVVPSGEPFGVKMFTRGVIVVGLSDIPCGGSRCNPARQAGLQSGDIILEIDGEAVNGNRMVGQRVEQSGGRTLELLVQRGPKTMTLQLQPVRSDNDGMWRAGVWVRDSSAGIGTLTYCDPATGLFTGLGHPICDVDTGELMPLNSGEVVGVDITGVRKGETGAPGELEGSFVNGTVLGRLLDNTDTGVYGTASAAALAAAAGQEAVPVAARSEVTPGPAVILTTLQGSTPQQYEVELEKVDASPGTDTKNMVLHVTDPRLPEPAGGIVQGMSGSPILQNGMLVGSVTHVFVNDPTRGFGIFAENVYMGAKQVLSRQNQAS